MFFGKWLATAGTRWIWSLERGHQVAVQSQPAAMTPVERRRSLPRVAVPVRDALKLLRGLQPLHHNRHRP